MLKKSLQVFMNFQISDEFSHYFLIFAKNSDLKSSNGGVGPSPTEPFNEGICVTGTSIATTATTREIQLRSAERSLAIALLANCGVPSRAACVAPRSSSSLAPSARCKFFEATGRASRSSRDSSAA